MEVYEYEVTKYDPHTREGGLFADYINTLLKLKTETSGTITGLETLKTRNGTLDSDGIRLNAAKRGLAKLFEFALG